MVLGTSLVLAMGLLIAMGISGAFTAAPSSAAPRLTVATGSTQQWAFGGAASASYSCTSTGCGDGTNISSLSLSYYVGWVVIYTATNISATQTEFEVQAAINATVTLSVAGCIAEGGPTCEQLSASANLAGRETALGFTNITSTGTVNATSGADAPLGNVPALAVMNAASNESFNFSGSYNENIGSGSTAESASVNFDLGGNEASTITFPTPLGLVPIGPSPGETWTANSSYSASGSYTSGYSLSATYNGHTNSSADWQHLSISPSGTLFANGTDLGSYTLTDNYTNPPTTVTAQAILIVFSNGEFTGADGFLLAPSGLYGGAEGFLGGVALIAGQHPAQAALGGSESAYYQQGVGFVGVDEAANTSSLGLSTGPAINLKAGPEPVSVAQSQYSAILSGSGGSSNGFNYTIVILLVVVVLVVVVVAVVAMRRRRKPAAMMAPPGASPMPAYNYPPPGAAPPPPPPPPAA